MPPTNEVFGGLDAASVLAVIAALVPLAAPAQFKGYFDIGALRIAELAEPDWAVRVGREPRALSLPQERHTARRRPGIEIRGIVRAKNSPRSSRAANCRPRF